MSDSFEGLGSRAVVDEFRGAHGMLPVQAEIPSDADKFDFSKVDGRYPCLHITKAKSATSKPAAVKVTKCVQGVYLDRDVDEIEIDLRIGTVITRTTDLFLPGTISLAATRCYRSWENSTMSFGRNATLSWDLYPTGSRQPYTYIDVNTCDGNPLHYERISKGTGYADAVYEHRATATAFLGSRFSWNGNGWNLTLRDGSLLLFPESYYAKKPVDGAMTKYRDAQGQTVTMERNNQRHLRRITSPDGRSITFEHDSADRIYHAEDDQKREVTYLYDHGGRLVEVRGVHGVRRYNYESTYLMKIEENGQSVAEFDYDRQRRISDFKLPDGRHYQFRYEYDRAETRRIVRSILTAPDRSTAKFDIPPN